MSNGWIDLKKENDGMKRLLTLTLASLALTGLCRGEDAPAAPQKICLVRIVERDKKVTYQLKSPEEYKALKADADLEKTLFAKAVAAAEQEWKKDPDLSKKSFPQSAIGDKTVDKTREFTDAAKADDALKAAEDIEFKKTDAAKEKEKDKAKAKGGDKKDDKKKADRERERDLLETRARDMFDAKLTELVQAAKNKDTKQTDKTKEEKK